MPPDHPNTMSRSVATFDTSLNVTALKGSIYTKYVTDDITIAIKTRITAIAVEEKHLP